MNALTSITTGVQFSPRAHMDRKIGAAVDAGTISSVDGTALETAMDAIDTALSSSRGLSNSRGLSSSAGTSEARLNPSKMKDRIDSLIDDQVKSGTLTEDQASELQSLFAQGGPHRPGGKSEGASDDDSDLAMGGVSGPGRPRGMRGPPPPPPSNDDDDDSDSSNSVSTNGMTASDQLSAMISFLENLRSNMAQTTYGNSSANANSSASSGLVVDSMA